MKFLPLLRLQVMHSYYSNGLCPDFQVEPTIETQTVLKNHRCILKTFPAGIQILITVGEQDSPLIPLDNDTKFIFQLRLQNPDFPLFTDLTQLRLRPYPLFINDPLGSEKLPQLSLQFRQASAPEINVFASVEIKYDQNWSKIDDEPELFQITFLPKEVKWLYYLITDKADNQFRVEDQGESPIQFSGIKYAEDDQGSVETDPIARALAEQYPGMTLWQFISTEPFPCRQKPRKSVQLSLGNEPLISALPNPSVNNYSQKMGGINPKEDILFHVIKYLTHQFQTTGDN